MVFCIDGCQDLVGPEPLSLIDLETGWNIVMLESAVGPGTLAKQVLINTMAFRTAVYV